jgi:hypothetical protein
MAVLIAYELPILELDCTASAKCRYQSHSKSGQSGSKISAFDCETAQYPRR